MDGNGFMPRADAVDGELFIETAQTTSATAALWRLLHAARQQPRPWLPVTVLCGDHGTGKSTLARRFARAAQRSVACDLLTDGPASTVWTDLDPRWLIEHFGACPAMCRPAVWADEPIVAKALRESEGTHPTITRTMSPRPDKDLNTMAAPEWFSPGNVAGHPTRKTSLAFVDAADRLLSVPPSRRRQTFDDMLEYSLLEPEGARVFVDEHLGVPMDASRILWVAAANAIDEIPPPIVDRLTVVEVGAMSRDDRRSVLRSVYAEINLLFRCFFDPDPAPAVLDRLADAPPRRARLAIEEAMARAAAEGRRTVRAADVGVAPVAPRPTTPGRRGMH